MRVGNMPDEQVKNPQGGPPTGDQPAPEGQPAHEMQPEAKPNTHVQTGDISAQQGGEVNIAGGNIIQNIQYIYQNIVPTAEIKDIEDLPPEPGDPPYQGLQYFDEEQADRFFGREALTARIVSRLAQVHFLTIIGASGSGKSSLVRAGVIPALRGGEALADGTLPPQDSQLWDIRTFNPGAHPLEALAANLVVQSDSVQVVMSLEKDLAQEKRTLGVAARQILAKTKQRRLLLVIDQFEEIFTQCRQDAERRAFIDNILTAADPAGGLPVSILLTLRADYYAQVAEHDALRDQIAQNQEFIGAMSRDELARAIVEPAAQGNWKLQEGLVEIILDDIGDEPGALPLLSHALLETWKRRRGRVMTLSGYTEAGGVRGAIAHTAEMVFQQRLTPQQRPIARMIFTRLAEIGQDALDTRRRAPFSELITRSTDENTIQAVLSILTDARLVTTGTVEPGDVKVVEVAHEALIREWPTLRNWLNENRQSLLIQRQITEAASEWEKLERDPGALYRGARLQQTLEWASQNNGMLSLQEQAFLDASQQAAKEEAERLRRLARLGQRQKILAGLAGVLVLAVVLVIMAANGFFEPRRMDGSFNIAVAEFGTINPDGSIDAHASQTGEQLSQWTVDYLTRVLKDDPTVQIWPNNRRTRVGVLQASDPQQRSAAASQLANEINAHLLVYGNVDLRQDPPVVQLEFYIAPQFQYHFEDIQGSYQAGQPIRIVDLNNPGPSVTGELSNQASSVAWISMGLTQVQLGQTQAALEAFQKAAQAAPTSAAVQFFTGREILFSSYNAQQPYDLYAAAEAAFQKAISLDDQYARSYIGLGSVYRREAQQRLSDAQDAGGLDEQSLAPVLESIQKALDTYQKGLALNPTFDQYGLPVAEVTQMAMANAYRLQGTAYALVGQVDAAQESLAQAIQIGEAVRPALEAIASQQETSRRYLAQAYEWLGEAYQWQGYAYELVFDDEQAAKSYQAAVDSYAECIQQADQSPDLIIQNEIVQLYCQPYRDEAQSSLDQLSGGQ